MALVHLPRGQEGRYWCPGCSDSRWTVEARSNCFVPEFVEGPKFRSRYGRVGPRGVVSQDRNCRRVETSQRTGDGTCCFRSKGQNGSGRDKVTRLEQAIAAMVDLKGPAMDALVAALKRAQQDAQEVHLESQIQAREAFLERTRKRIVHIDQERAAEVLRIQESERRLGCPECAAGEAVISARRCCWRNVSNRWCRICNCSIKEVLWLHPPFPSRIRKRRTTYH